MDARALAAMAPGSASVKSTRALQEAVRSAPRISCTRSVSATMAAAKSRASMVPGRPGRHGASVPPRAPEAFKKGLASTPHSPPQSVVGPRKASAKSLGGVMWVCPAPYPSLVYGLNGKIGRTVPAPAKECRIVPETCRIMALARVRAARVLQCSSGPATRRR